MIKGLYDFAKKWSMNGSVFLYSDPHFEDNDMANFFNYMKSEEQITRINAIVHKNDYLVILGDFGNPEWLSMIKCKHLIGILGNHDQSKEKYKPYFEELYDGAVFISKKILLSHEPIYGLDFCFNIHGHCHGNQSTGSMHMNLAADVIDYTPVSLGKLIKDGIIANIPSIHRITIDKATERKLDKEKIMDFDLRAEAIVTTYIEEHLDKTDVIPDFEVFTVWKCKTLQNWKYLLSSTLLDGMYYELTFNGNKNEWYLDAYKKFENRVIPEMEIK